MTEVDDQEAAGVANAMIAESEPKAPEDDRTVATPCPTTQRGETGRLAVGMMASDQMRELRMAVGNAVPAEPNWLVEGRLSMMTTRSLASRHPRQMASQPEIGWSSRKARSRIDKREGATVQFRSGEDEEWGSVAWYDDAPEFEHESDQ